MTATATISEAELMQRYASTINVKVQPANRCRFWHRWVLIKDTGATQYHECKDCKARIGKSTSAGYQPINIMWVSGLEEHP